MKNSTKQYNGNEAIYLKKKKDVVMYKKLVNNKFVRDIDDMFIKGGVFLLIFCNEAYGNRQKN